MRINGMISATLLAGMLALPSLAMSQGHGQGHRPDNRPGPARQNDRDRQDNRRFNQDRRDNRDNGRWNNDRRDDEYDRREETKNEWRNLGIASGLLGVLGLLEHDRTLTFLGSAGALYSAHRYEEDRKSQNQLTRARARYFEMPRFFRNGNWYERKTVYRGGQKYYQFVRCG